MATNEKQECRRLAEELANRLEALIANTRGKSERSLLGRALMNVELANECIDATKPAKHQPARRKPNDPLEPEGGYTSIRCNPDGTRTTEYVGPPANMGAFVLNAPTRPGDKAIHPLMHGMILKAGEDVAAQELADRRKAGTQATLKKAAAKHKREKPAAKKRRKSK